MGNETGNVITSIHNKVCGPANREVTFVMQRLAQIFPTSETCYLIECDGRSCIVDECKCPEHGSGVLVNVAGKMAWGTKHFHPERIVTDNGRVLEAALYEDVRIIGVITHEIASVHRRSIR